MIWVIGLSVLAALFGMCLFYAYIIDHYGNYSKKDKEE
jgi:hypothetical protein